MVGSEKVIQNLDKNTLFIIKIISENKSLNASFDKF